MAFQVGEKFDPEFLDPEKYDNEIAWKWAPTLLRDVNWISKVKMEFLLIAINTFGDLRYMPMLEYLTKIVVGVNKRQDADSLEKELLSAAIKFLSDKYASKE